MAATGKCKGKHSLKVPGEQKALIAKCTAENGIVAALANTTPLILATLE